MHSEWHFAKLEVYVFHMFGTSDDCLINLQLVYSARCASLEKANRGFPFDVLD